MAKEDATRIQGDLVTDKPELTLEDVCESCVISQTEIATYVEEGIVKAEGADPAQWRFSHFDVVEVRRAQRLTRDLGLNPAGVALAFQLMDEIEVLKTQLSRLDRKAGQS